MSYILDAIKKSENERVQSSEPEPLSMQSGNAYRRVSTPSNIPWKLVIVLVVAAVLVWWFWPSLSDFVASARSQTNSELQGESLPQTSQQEAGLTTAGQSQARNTTTVGVAELDTAKPIYTADGPLPPANQILELWQMPADFQAKIPELAFSFHVYSATPEKRTIIINGRRMREGQMVTSKIKLRLITDTGIVLYADNEFFHIDVVEKW